MNKNIALFILAAAILVLGYFVIIKKSPFPDTQRTAPFSTTTPETKEVTPTQEPSSNVKSPSTPIAAQPCGITNFSVVPTTVTVGQSVTIKWNTEGCKWVTLATFGEVGLSGTKIAYPTDQTGYGLIASDNVITKQAKVVIVNVNQKTTTKPCTISSFTVNGSGSTTVDIDEGATLRWNTENCSSVEISEVSRDGGFAVSGSAELLHPQTKPYTLTARGPSGSVNKTVYITVRQSYE